jgi:Tfp pilus assembly protein PilX
MAVTGMEDMKLRFRNNGSVLLMVIFIIALLGAVVMGILQVNTEEIQIMRNQIDATQAICTAEAGLNDAFAQLRADSSWSAGFTDKAFNGGSYTVTVAGTSPKPTVTSTGATSQGFIARIAADLTIDTSGGPYIIRIDNLRINE